MFFFLMIRRPPRSTLDRSSAASDVYKRQLEFTTRDLISGGRTGRVWTTLVDVGQVTDRYPALAEGFLASLALALFTVCLLYTSDAADERSSVDLGGRRIIKKKNIARTQRERAKTPSQDEAQR